MWRGVYQEMQSDHVPQQSLFPSPAQDNLITVPACKSCNSGAAKDDEWRQWERVEVASTAGRWACLFID